MSRSAPVLQRKQQLTCEYAAQTRANQAQLRPHPQITVDITYQTRFDVPNCSMPGASTNAHKKSPALKTSGQAKLSKPATQLRLNLNATSSSILSSSLINRAMEGLVKPKVEKIKLVFARPATVESRPNVAIP